VLAQAARAVSAVVGGRSADEALARFEQAESGAPRAAIRAVTLGTLRWYFRLDALAGALQGETALVPLLRALLVVALHQLEYSRGRPEVTVSSAVEATRLLRQPRAAGLMNALLRRFGREREGLMTRVLADPVAASAHPAWLLEVLRASWPDQMRQIIEADNSAPPMVLRVDLSRGSLETYELELAARGLAATRVPACPSALLLSEPRAVEELPGFAEGRVSVQDGGAQLATVLLDVQPGERVLDACAAPGGKTGALLEATDGAIELTAVDIDATRLQRVHANLERLGRVSQATLLCADLSAEPNWWDGRPFDRILLDAPCSSLGVIRRHPDIKLLRRAGDIEVFAGLQRALLARCLALLAPGGRLLYSTCSLLPAENDEVVGAVAAGAPRARVLPLEPQPSGALAAIATSCRQGIQLLPGNSALTDGFYYACATVT
jgi:16S rRNA (cytosine967-C5)-methyltransferase